LFIADDPDELIEKFVRPSDHVHLAATLSRPNALQRSLARVFYGQRSLTVSTAAIHASAHALALSGCCSKVITCFIGDTHPSPRPNPLYENLRKDDPYEVELWSLLTYTQRLIAGALGQPFAVTSSHLRGTYLGENKDRLIYDVSLGDGGQVTLMRSLRPDIAFYHGVCADRNGNIVLAHPYGEGAWAAFSSKRGVIASVERIIDDVEDSGLAGHVSIPANRVLGICQAKMGAHPNSLNSTLDSIVDSYTDDYAHLEEIVKACKSQESAEKWFKEWVLDGNYSNYLRKVLLSQRKSTPFEPPPSDRVGTSSSLSTNHLELSSIEKTIILGAREIVRKVKKNNHDLILAGIGSSHIATWLAIRQLSTEGCSAVYGAELGIVGNKIADCDKFLFSQQHSRKAQYLAGIPEVLGGLVAANPNALGVLSTAEIDDSGNLNTTLDMNGKWITGCGGANDIASTTECIVVGVASKRRFVEHSTCITSPGNNVRTVVTQFGVFRKNSDGVFVLRTYFDDGVVSPIEKLYDFVNWGKVKISDDIEIESPISPEEVIQLRAIINEESQC
jgi:glutaconate coA-transferase-like protein